MVPFLRTRISRSILSLLQVISACFMLWKGAAVLAGTPYPAMVVITNSMAPAFDPGDVLFVYRRPGHGGQIRVGDLPVCRLPNRPYPFVHRVIGVYYDDDEGEMILTKGDNNHVDDSIGGLYSYGEDYVHRDQVVGFVRGYVPFLGWLVIALQNPTQVVDALTSSTLRVEDHFDGDKNGF